MSYAFLTVVSLLDELTAGGGVVKITKDGHLYRVEVTQPVSASLFHTVSVRSMSLITSLLDICTVPRLDLAYPQANENTQETTHENPDYRS